MKNKPHVGNVTLILDGTFSGRGKKILLGRERPKKKSDAKRERKKVGCGFLVPPGGGTEVYDKSQKHAAQREVQQETGLFIPLSSFKRIGTLWGYEGDEPIWLVYLYLAEGDFSDQELIVNEELIELAWFPISRLPFNDMLPGDKKWLPRLLRGEKLSIKIFSDKNVENVKHFQITPVKSFN